MLLRFEDCRDMPRKKELGARGGEVHSSVAEAIDGPCCEEGVGHLVQKGGFLSGIIVFCHVRCVLVAIVIEIATVLVVFQILEHPGFHPYAEGVAA